MRDAAGEIRIEWKPVDKAVRYVVVVFATDGLELLRREVTTAPVVIDPTIAALAGHADERLFARVDAIDALGVTLTSSPRITIPARRQETP